MTPDTGFRQGNFLSLVEKHSGVNVPFLMTRNNFVVGGGLLETAKLVRENFVPNVRLEEISVLNEVSDWIITNRHFDLLVSPELRYKNWDNWDLPGTVYLNENTAMYLRTGVLKAANPKASNILVAPEIETANLKLDLLNVLSESFIKLKTMGNVNVSDNKKASTTKNLILIGRLVGSGVDLVPVERAIAIDVLTADFVRKYYARLLTRERNLLKQ